jgi:hypothetical protein
MMLQETPPVAELLDRLQALVTAVTPTLNLPDNDWQWRPAPAEWSLTELCCHLRDVEREVHQPRFRSVMAEENAFLPGVTADEWAISRGYAEENGRLALQEFLAARTETIALLNAVSDNYWQRQGRHAFFGPTSAHELLNLVVNHDQAHWEQMQKLLNKDDKP